jgi:two-component system response regulator GlrR
VVEDQDDVRRMLVTALELEGHVVDDAATAADGLRRMQQTRYNLVLSDYAMPGGTGTWMLHEAARQGLMNGAVALIVTAHPDIRDLGNVEVISKPLDLDQFLEQVRRILGTGYILRSPGLPPASPGDTPQRPNVMAGRYLAELVLYVSSASRWKKRRKICRTAATRSAWDCRGWSAPAPSTSPMRRARWTVRPWCREITISSV